MQGRGFHGGLRLDGRRQAAGRPIRPCPVRSPLRLSLRQHPGAAALTEVAVGQRVRAGQRLARGDGPRSVDVHAPCNGEVLAVDSAGDGLVVIGPDPAQPGDAADTFPPLGPDRATPNQLWDRIREAGIVGLGGAGFPTAEKLAPELDAVVLNGAECEPYIACDRRLLEERAERVAAGGELLRRACGADRLHIAIESDMPSAQEALIAVQRAGACFDLHVLPARYPQGAERPLIESLFGIEVPRDGLPRDVGIGVFNVGTAEAVWQAVIRGRPLIRRLVSVAGGGVVEPCVVEALLGTPLADIVAAAGGYRDEAVQLRLGGPLTGHALRDDAGGLRKTDNALLVLTAEELPATPAGMPCIRCGDCASVCPSRLQPQLLWQFLLADQSERLSTHGLFDCIECAACDLACPSGLPLTRRFAEKKQALRRESLQRTQAQAAKLRFDQRQTRLEREAAERAAQRAERQRRVLAKDAVRAALDRARGKPSE